jgi:hypothetical protein
MPDEEIRAVFTRLNRNVMALTAQELRHATYWGDFIQGVEAVAEDAYWSTTGVFTPNDVRRMLDVEFIGELAVAWLHGLQNKKDSLDDWYAAYEEGFESRGEMESLFRIVMGELSQLLPDIARTRWSKKSDFYTLFLVLARNGASLPLSREGRSVSRAMLIAFGHDVDRLTADPEADVSGEVKRYAAAVGRAASDLNQRKIRDGIVDALLSGVWTAEAKGGAALDADAANEVRGSDTADQGTTGEADAQPAP